MKTFTYTKDFARVDFKGLNINLPDSSLKKIKLGHSVNLFKQGLKPIRLNIKSEGPVYPYKNLDFSYYLNEDKKITIVDADYIPVTNLTLQFVKGEKINEHIQANDDTVFKYDLGFTTVFRSSHWSYGQKDYVEEKYIREVLLLDYSLQAKAQEVVVNRKIESTTKLLKELGKTLSSYNQRKDKNLKSILFNAIYALDRIIGLSGVEDPDLERFRDFVQDLGE